MLPKKPSNPDFMARTTFFRKPTGSFLMSSMAAVALAMMLPSSSDGKFISSRISRTTTWMTTLTNSTIRPSGSPNAATMRSNVSIGASRLSRDTVSQMARNVPVIRSQEMFEPGHRRLDRRGRVADDARLRELVVHRLAAGQQRDEALDQVLGRARDGLAGERVPFQDHGEQVEAGDLVRVLAGPAQQRLLDQLQDLEQDRGGERADVLQQRERAVGQRREVLDEVAAGSPG